MPTHTIPLVFAPNQRGPIITSTSAPSKDARMVRAITTLATNPITKSLEACAEKVPGWAELFVPAAGSSGSAVYSSGTFTSSWSAFGATSTIWGGTVGVTSMGTVGAGQVGFFNEGNLGGEQTLLFTTTDHANDSGYFLPHDAITGFTFTGDFTSGNPNITNVSSLTGLYVGQKLSTVGSQVAAGTRISSITAPSTVTMTANAGANGTGTTVTREGIAKIIDSDVPSFRGGLIELDGYVFGCGVLSDGTAVIAHSSQNDASSWSASNRIPPNISGQPRGIALYRDSVVYLADNSVQFFRNAGNLSGSVLSQIDELSISGIGAAGAISTGVTPIAYLGGTIYWISIADGVVSGICRLNGFSVENITANSPAVIRELSTVISSFGTSVCAFDGFSMFGAHYLYVGSGDIGYLYCVETNQWSEAGFFSGGMRVHGLEDATNPSLLGVRMTGGTGKVYEMDKTNITYQDDSSAYTMTLQTPSLVLNKGRPFTINSIDLIADTQSAGTATLSRSIDDFANFTDYPTTFDMSSQTKRIHRGGYCKSSIAFKLAHSHNSAFRGQALVVDWSPAG